MTSNEKGLVFQCKTCKRYDTGFNDYCPDCWFGDGDNPQISYYEAKLTGAVPTHYDEHYGGRVQPIELMQAQMNPVEFQGFLRGNIIKYASRFGRKDECTKDAEKICRYAEWLKQAVGGKVINPRE